MSVYPTTASSSFFPPKSSTLDNPSKDQSSFDGSLVARTGEINFRGDARSLSGFHSLSTNHPSDHPAYVGIADDVVLARERSREYSRSCSPTKELSESSLQSQSSINASSDSELPTSVFLLQETLLEKMAESESMNREVEVRSFFICIE